MCKKIPSWNLATSPPQEVHTLTYDLSIPVRKLFGPLVYTNIVFLRSLFKIKPSHKRGKTILKWKGVGGQGERGKELKPKMYLKGKNIYLTRSLFLTKDSLEPNSVKHIV